MAQRPPHTQRVLDGGRNILKYTGQRAVGGVCQRVEVRKVPVGRLLDKPVVGSHRAARSIEGRQAVRSGLALVPSGSASIQIRASRALTLVIRQPFVALTRRSSLSAVVGGFTGRHRGHRQQEG